MALFLHQTLATRSSTEVYAMEWKRKPPHPVKVEFLKRGNWVRCVESLIINGLGRGCPNPFWVLISVSSSLEANSVQASYLLNGFFNRSSKDAKNLKRRVSA